MNEGDGVAKALVGWPRCCRCGQWMELFAEAGLGEAWACRCMGAAEGGGAGGGLGNAKVPAVILVEVGLEWWCSVCGGARQISLLPSEAARYFA